MRFVARLRILALPALAVATIPACVMVPVPASLDKVEAPVSREDLRLAPGERVALVGGVDVRDEDQNLTCVRGEMKEAMGPSGSQVISDQDFRDWFHPWLDAVRRPRTLDELATVLEEPELQQRILRHKLRFLATVRVETTEGALEGPALPHIGGGVASYERRSDLTALLWDLSTATSAGEVHVAASGGGGFVGYGFYGMWTIPRTETAACRALGQALGALLTGREIPPPVERDTASPDPVELSPDRSH